MAYQIPLTIKETLEHVPVTGSTWGQEVCDVMVGNGSEMRITGRRYETMVSGAGWSVRVS